MNPRPKIYWLCLSSALAICMSASAIRAEDPPQPAAEGTDQGLAVQPTPQPAEEAQQGPDVRPMQPDIEDETTSEITENATEFPCGPECMDVPYGFHFGYGYRPLGYSFWPRYGHYADFSYGYLPDPYRFYRRPYVWHPYWSTLRYRPLYWHGDF